MDETLLDDESLLVTDIVSLMQSVVLLVDCVLSGS